MKIRNYTFVLILFISLTSLLGFITVEKKDDSPSKSIKNKSNLSEFVIEENSASFPKNTTWRDYPVDDDRNGLYNRLVVAIGFYNPHDSFGVYGILIDKYQNILGTATYDNYNEPYVLLSFQGQPIYANAQDGPYILKASLFTPGWWGSIDFGELNFSLTYETSFTSYNSSQFERPRAIITGFSDYGIDTNSDSYYDEIIIEIESEVADYGFYQLITYFEHSIQIHNTEYEISRQWDGYLQPGNNIIELQIQASEFYKRNGNGRIRLNYVQLGLYGEPQHILINAYNTSSVFYHELVPPSVELTGRFWDRGIDTDSNGLFNELEMIIELNFTITGYYEINLDLISETSQDSSLSYEEWFYDYWNTGVTNISVKINNAPFYAFFNTSTFVIQSLTIRDNFGVIQQYIGRPYTTREYLHIEFDFPHIFATGRYWDQGHDSNSNGFFDELEITFEVNITSVGSYEISLELIPTSVPSHRWRKYFSDTWDFGTLGVQNMTVTIDTESFYSIRKNVSFMIEYLEFSLGDGVRFRTESPYTTQEYQYTHFEKPDVYLTGKNWDFGTDRNSNGVFDEITSYFQVNSTQTGAYTIYARIRSTNLENTWTQEQNVYEHLNRCLNYVYFYFDMSSFHSGELNTSFIIDSIEIRDENWYTIDIAYSFYITQIYLISDFEVPSVYVTGNYSDYGEDSNENGKIDELVIEIEVNVAKSGVYRFDLGIAPLIPVWDSSHWISVDHSLSQGIQNITIQTYVTLPYALRLDTAFIIHDLTIYDTEDWREVSRIDSPIVTRMYQYNEFDLPGIYLTGKFWETGLDTDSDTLLDLIFFEIEVNITQSGYYTYDYHYYSTDWYLSHGEYISEQFSEGLRNITLIIDTKFLYTYFDDLTITLEHLRLQNYQGNLIDRTISQYSTRIYSFNEFDPPGAYLENRYLDYGLDIDHDGKYEKIALFVGVTVVKNGTYTLNLDLNVVPTWNSFKESITSFWEVGEYSINVNISASQLPLSLGGNEQIWLNLNYIEILENSAFGELQDYQWYPYSTRGYGVNRFDNSFDTSQVSVYPTSNGINVLFGGIVLFFIGAVFLLRNKKLI